MRVQSSSNPGISAFYVPSFSLFVCLDPGLGNGIAVIAQDSLCVCIAVLVTDMELIPSNAQEALFPLVTLGTSQVPWVGRRQREGWVEHRLVVSWTSFSELPCAINSSYINKQRGSKHRHQLSPCKMRMPLGFVMVSAL